MIDHKTVARTGIWSVVLQWSRFGLNTVIFLILTRFLTLADIGAFAAAFAPIRFFQQIQRVGFSDSLIVDQVQTPSFVSSVAALSMGLGIVASIALFISSFYLGPLLDDPRAGDYLAAMAVTPLMFGATAIPEGLLRKQLKIKSLALRTTVALALSGAIAIWLGVTGWGGWALTFFALSNAFFSSLFTLTLSKWRPSARPTWADCKAVLPMVLHISGRNLAGSMVLPALQLIVATNLGVVASGAFQIAQRFVQLADTLTLAPARFTALPLMMRAQAMPGGLNAALPRAMGALSAISSPVYLGLMAAAPPLLPLVIGQDNAEQSVEILQLMCLIGFTSMISSLFIATATSVGRPDLPLYRGLLGLGTALILCYILSFFNIFVFTIGFVIANYISIPFIFWAMRQLNIAVKPIVLASLKPYVAGLLMAGILMGLDLLMVREGFDEFVRFAVIVPLGAVLYVGFLMVFAREAFNDLKATVLLRRKARQRPEPAGSDDDPEQPRGP